MAKATRTVNPLHFEDLEPHRFEDLVRQLAYDFRDWHSLEATGRLGADEGVDIRAVERVGTRPDTAEPEEENEPDDNDAGPSERVWVIQCKREKRIGPSDMAAIVEAAVPEGGEIPHGLIVAAACDFSRKTRDAGRDVARQRGVLEIFFWGKAELEDMLFQPKNDHLLFAYFSISLQARRRSLKTNFSARLTTKKRLAKALGEVRGRSFQHVLIRNAANSDYPFIKDSAAFRKRPDWRYYTFVGHPLPDHLAVVVRRYFAYVDDKRERWDAVLDFDDGWLRHPPLVGLEDEEERHGKRWRIHDYWYKLPEKNRAWLEVLGLIHYDRVLVVDELGDSWHEGPHLLVEYVGDMGPFDRYHDRLEIAVGFSREEISPDKETRIEFFPVPIPEPEKESK